MQASVCQLEEAELQEAIKASIAESMVEADRSRSMGSAGGKGRAPGKLGKPSGDIFFGYGQTRPGSAPASLASSSAGKGKGSGPAPYGQQGLQGARQGTPMAIWHDAFVDGVQGFKIVLGDCDPDWTAGQVVVVMVGAVVVVSLASLVSLVIGWFNIWLWGLCGVVMGWWW